MNIDEVQRKLTQHFAAGVPLEPDTCGQMLQALLQYRNRMEIDMRIWVMRPEDVRP